MAKQRIACWTETTDGVPKGEEFDDSKCDENDFWCAGERIFGCKFVERRCAADDNLERPAEESATGEDSGRRRMEAKKAPNPCKPSIRFSMKKFQHLGTEYPPGIVVSGRLILDLGVQELGGGVFCVGVARRPLLRGRLRSNASGPGRESHQAL